MCHRVVVVNTGLLCRPGKGEYLLSDQIWLWYVLAVCAGLHKVNTGSLCRSGYGEIQALYAGLDKVNTVSLCMLLPVCKCTRECHFRGRGFWYADGVTSSDMTSDVPRGSYITVQKPRRYDITAGSDVIPLWPCGRDV